MKYVENRSSYSPPKLTKYGHMTKLTAAGSGATTETTCGQGTTTKKC